MGVITLDFPKGVCVCVCVVVTHKFCNVSDSYKWPGLSTTAFTHLISRVPPAAQNPGTLHVFGV